MTHAALPRSAAYARLCFIASEKDWPIGLHLANDRIPRLRRWTLTATRGEDETVSASALREDFFEIVDALSMQLEREMRKHHWLALGEYPR